MQIIDETRENILFLFFASEALFLCGSAMWLVSYIAYNSITGILVFIFLISLAAIKAAIGIYFIVWFVGTCNTYNCFQFQFRKSVSESSGQKASVENIFLSVGICSHSHHSFIR